ncbi:MAG: hypothetical protein Phyf2KO_21790 [Phycisphaerales bacterium]
MRYFLPLLLCVVCTACGGDGTSGIPPGPAPWERPDLERPVVEGNQQGLELRVWAIEDQDGLIAEMIDSYQGRPTPMLDSQRTAWRQSGFVPISIPIDELNLARGRMRLVGPEQQDWFGVLPDWHETLSGRRVEAGQLLSLADGQMQTPRGKLRLLSRCWVVPGADGPELQTELCVQLQRTLRAPNAVELAVGDRTPIERQGLIFPELAASFVMRKDEALVLVPIAPEFDPMAIIDPERAAEVHAEAGPPVPSVPTVGEAMLTSVEAGGVAPVRRRAIVVLIARLPEEYRLLSQLGDQR